MANIIEAQPKKYKLVYECESKEQQLLWKAVFDAAIAFVDRMTEEE
jgi:hypothetical protein